MPRFTTPLTWNNAVKDFFCFVYVVETNKLVKTSPKIQLSFAIVAYSGRLQNGEIPFFTEVTQTPWPKNVAETMPNPKTFSERSIKASIVDFGIIN